MTDTNASLAGVRKELNSVKGTRDAVYRGLVEAWKRMGSTEESLKEGMKFYQNLYKKTLKLFESIKSVFPTSPLQQPIKPSDTSTTEPQDSAYKPIVPFMSPPGDSNRPPVPSRRLKPTNEIEEHTLVDTEKQKVFDTEKQKIFATEKQKAFDTEKQKVFDTEKQKVFETEKKTVFDTEKQKIFATEKQKVFDTEKQKIDAIEDDTELALINWAAIKQENNEINITQPISPIKEQIQDIRFPPDQSNPVPKLSPVPFLPPVQLANQITASEHIPKVPTLATPTLDTSQLTQLIQTNQSELSFAVSSLQSSISATGQSVAELALSMSAVVNHSSQSNAAISNLNQTTANQSASIEQLSSHLQTTNQNVVYTSQLVKLIETSLLAKLDSVENSTRETANKLSQLIEQMTQHKQDTVIRIDSIMDRISSNQSAHSLELSTLNTALGEIREELRLIRNKQESILLAPGQSESIVIRDPLSFENRPMEEPSQVDQLWDLLDKKPDIVPSACDTFVPSELTAFSPVRNRPSSAFQLAAGQSAVSLGMSSSIPSANQVASLPQPHIANSQSVSSLDPLSSLHTQAVPQMQYPQPSMVPPHPHFAPSLSQVSTPLPQLQQMGPSPLLQTQHFQQTQYNPHTQAKLLVPQTIQPASQHPQAVQSNVHIPVIPAVQSYPHIPVIQSVQSNPHIPVIPAVQSNVHNPVIQSVQSNPHIPVIPGVQSNVALNPQQHAYLQQLQKQLITSSPQSLSPDQLIAFQKQMLYLSQPPPQ